MPKRAATLTPFLVTAGVGITPLFPGESLRDGFWLMVAVRTMGTSGWVEVGDITARISRMYYANDFYVWDCPPDYAFNFANFMCASENGDAVLEITGMMPDLMPALSLGAMAQDDSLKDFVTTYAGVLAALATKGLI
jgi:hypothetical protein